MGWSVIGNWLATAELDGTTLTPQEVKFNDEIILRACRTWFILYNDPALTSIEMRIYSDDNGSPGKILYTSTNAVTKAELLTGGNTNGIRECFFEFDNPTFNGNDTYHFVPVATGYTGVDGTHIAWKKGWPDPVYRTGVTTNYVSAARAPYDLYFIGADL